MMVSVTLVSTVLSIVAVTLHLLWRAEDRRRHDASAAEALSQLSVQFREDAHRATAIERFAPEEGAPESVAFLLADDLRAVWHGEENVAVRREFSGQEMTRRDLFRLAPLLRVEAVASNPSELPGASLEISRLSDRVAPDAVRRPWGRIDAAARMRHDSTEEEDS